MPRSRSSSEAIPELPAVVRPGPLRTHVLEALRELVITRSLQPGQHLVESELAEQLQVSRGPVREALQALHQEGWVDLLPGRGAFVHAPSAQEADEVFLVRATLESEAAGLAAARIEPADVADLRAICLRGRQAVDKGDETVVVLQNSTLHRRVAELSGVRLLIDYIATLDMRVRWFYRPLVRLRGFDSWDEHDLLIGALEAHDSAKAKKVMRKHSEETRKAYRAVDDTE